MSQSSSPAEAREAALVDTAEAGTRRLLADRIVPGTISRAALFQGNSLGWTPVGLETTGIQYRIYVEDIVAVIGDRRTVCVTDERIKRRDRA